MYASFAALALLGLALAWTALNKSGVLAFDWYISLILTGSALLAFWSRSRRQLSPPLPRWVVWVIRCLLAYGVFQAIPLPLAVLQHLSPVRAELTRATIPIAGSVTAAPIAVDPAAHILWLLTLMGCTAVFFLARELTFRLRSRLFLAVFPPLLLAVLEAILGLLQVVGGAEQAVGSYNSRDHYCCILELTLPLTIAFGLALFNDRKEKAASIWPAVRAVLCWLASALLTLGILFSLSRAGWIDSVMAILVLVALVLLPRVESKMWRAGLLAGLGAITLGVFIFASPAAMLGRLVDTLTPDAEGRTYIWRELAPLTREFRWFGAGLMGFDPVFLKYQAVIAAKRIDFAHNDFLQYLIELGLLGFLPLIAAVGAIIVPIARSAWQALPQRRFLLIGVVASLFALFLHSLVDFNLYIPANVFVFAWVLGFGSAVAAVQD